jgi:DNA-binding transcriptional ArsR family regulator
VVISDPQAVRALAHQARMEALDELFSSGRSRTATELASRSNLTPSAMSYHLRALERFGLVERAASAGDARERRWKATGEQLVISPLRDSQAGIMAYTDMELSQYRERLATEIDFRSQVRDTDDSVRAHPYKAQGSMVLDSEAEEEFLERVFDLVREFELRSAEVEDGHADARRVHYLLSAFPDRGHKPGNPAVPEQPEPTAEA